MKRSPPSATSLECSYMCCGPHRATRCLHPRTGDGSLYGTSPAPPEWTIHNPSMYHALNCALNCAPRSEQRCSHPHYTLSTRLHRQFSSPCR
ncbi:hypothetical protein BD626DRAFT_521824 [Schizophyllum amplum]|uniref:Uncharacterized protein n=1 Tax=Schizophyllum amplum TaxID=97359 RepID=A0A550BTI5_9AGAR|nr:hypothetical protein BD626DRAFT_521824 [Auriculariopsis ampla]